MANTAAGKKDGGKTTRGEAANRQAMEATLRAAAFGEIMSVLLQSPRHSRVMLGTLARQMVPAYLTEQYV
jgi:hemolysin-activating ACP:hemolysin acyltransferase